MRTPGIRCGTTERSHAEVAERAARIAGALAGLGVGAGDAIALVLRNSVEFVEVSLAAGLLGAHPVPVNWHWRRDELRYLLDDSASRLVFAHTSLLEEVLAGRPPGLPVVEVAEGGGGAGPSGTEADLESLVAAGGPLPDEAGTGGGIGVIYTSGTTGRPKGIVRQAVSPGQMATMVESVMVRMGLRQGGSTLVPAPLYHTAPNLLTMVAARIGADITIMERFDAEEMLALLERHRIEQVQVVPTMFVRLLRLAPEVRDHYDLGALRRVVHAAAPCPVHVKERMIEWLGPIVVEYYGASETGAVVWCDSDEWLTHRGTVGAPVATAAVRIVGPDGTEAATGEIGTVYLKPPDHWPDFTYLGDDDKRRAMELDGFVTVGDLGCVDADGYLYLADRAHDMVISGGVNIYPAEIEAVLLELDGVADCAVFGVPDEEFGEALAAHVETSAGAGLTEQAVRDHVRSRLAGYKVPRTVVLTAGLPREDSGKLLKRKLRAPYWEGRERAI